MICLRYGNFQPIENHIVYSEENPIVSSLYPYVCSAAIPLLLDEVAQTGILGIHLYAAILPLTTRYTHHAHVHTMTAVNAVVANETQNTLHYGTHSHGECILQYGREESTLLRAYLRASIPMCVQYSRTFSSMVCRAPSRLTMCIWAKNQTFRVQMPVHRIPST